LSLYLEHLGNTHFHFSYSNKLPPNDPSKVRTDVADPRADSLTHNFSKCSQAHPKAYNNNDNSSRTTTFQQKQQHFGVGMYILLPRLVNYPPKDRRREK